jgi:hypothetical protein
MFLEETIFALDTPLWSRWRLGHTTLWHMNTLFSPRSSHQGAATEVFELIWCISFVKRELRTLYGIPHTHRNECASLVLHNRRTSRTTNGTTPVCAAHKVAHVLVRWAAGRCFGEWRRCGHPLWPAWRLGVAPLFGGGGEKNI